jgi:prolipoprotein diacylglyceryl transferase
MDKILNWNLDPTIFWITDSFPLKYYGLLFVSGLLLGYAIEKYIFNKENISLEVLDKLLIYIIIGTVLGARLGHCIFYEFEYFFNHPLEILLPIQKIGDGYKFTGFRGLASHGGTIGVFIAIVLFCKKQKIDLLWILDRVAIAVPVSAAFIRLGNFMNSEIYGKPTNGTWGVVFQRDDLIPRHPTQLYEAFSYFFIFGIMLFLYKSKKAPKVNGILFGIFMILLFSARFIIEFFKENQESFESQMPINMGQILSIPFIISGLILVIWKGNSTSFKQKEKQF